MPPVPASATASTTLTLDGHAVRLTSLDKVLYPETGTTKADAIAYLRAVSTVILPQLRDRVVTRINLQGGVGGERFFERHAPKGMPDWIRAFTISASPGSKDAKRVRYPVIDNEAGLVWFANRALTEFHTPQWHIGPRGGIGKPDRLVIDLDPGEGAGLDACAAVAHIVASRLRKDGIEPYPVTSGGKGLHLYAAVRGNRSASAVHDYVERIARELAAAHPERIIAVQDRSQRAGKVLLDWGQNHPARSTATPYTLRAKFPYPTVTAPRSWDEIGPGLAQLGPDEVLARLERDGDLMEPYGLV
jgi:bifunctional non-homologous end joining protein LigD